MLPMILLMSRLPGGHSSHIQDTVTAVHVEDSYKPYTQNMRHLLDAKLNKMFQK